MHILSRIVRLELITISFFLTFTFGSFNTDLLVILLQSGQILTSLGEFTFFHTLTYIPVDEGTFGVHKIEFMIDTREYLSDGSGVGDHAHSTHNLSQITSGNDGGRLVVDTAFETGGGPVNELNGTLGLDGSNGSVDILGDNITTVHQATSHVFTV